MREPARPVRVHIHREVADMAANHLTFEDAAQRLGLSPEEFKRRLKTDHAFKELDRGKIRDGSSFRFKESAVDELARQLGASSNPENPLPSSVGPVAADSDDFKVHTAATKAADDEPLSFGTEDVFSLASDDSGAEPPQPAKKGSDSDIRLDAAKKKPAGDEGVPTEEISIDFAGPGSAVIKGGSSAKLSAPKSSGKLTSDSSKNLAKPGTGDSSEFELSLDADSDDFELKLNTEASDEVELGSLPKDKDTPSSGRRGAESGILSRKPNDSGPALEKGKAKDKPPLAPKDDSGSDEDFELTLDSSSAVSGTALGGLKGKKPADSDSEFELTLDDSSGSGELERAALGDAEASKGDIFETDFEIPPMEESGSEAVAVESSDSDPDTSDIDVALDDSDVAEADAESGSEVVLLEDEEEAGAPVARGKGKAPAKGRAKKAVADEDEEGDVDLAEVGEDEDDESASKALKGAKARRRDEEDEEEAEAVPAGAYRPVPWGVVPVLFLVPAFVLMLFGALMGYELLQTMWGYQQPRKPSAPIVKWVANSLDMELKDQ